MKGKRPARAPRRGNRSPSRLELQGDALSHGPTSRSPKSFHSSTPGQEPSSSSATACVPAQGLRATVPAGAPVGPLLRTRLPSSSAALATVEGQSQVSALGNGQASAASPKPTLPGSLSRAPPSPSLRGPDRREGHPYRNYLKGPATDRDATSNSTATAARPCADSARETVATPLARCASGKGGGWRTGPDLCPPYCAAERDFANLTRPAGRGGEPASRTPALSGPLFFRLKGRT